MVRTVLLVSPTRDFTNPVARSLRRAGYRMTITTSFEGAKRELASAPDVVVTTLKLGEYNGMHVALRSVVAGVRAIVVSDKSFESEIEQLGATWISHEAALSGELPGAITRSLQPVPPADPTGWYNTPADSPIAPTDDPGGDFTLLH